MSNIKFTNGVLLDQASVDGLCGIDVENVLYSGTSSPQYIATEDCWAIGDGNGWEGGVQINGIYINYYYTPTGNPGGIQYTPVRKGQTVKFVARNAKIYGLKK